MITQDVLDLLDRELPPRELFAHGDSGKRVDEFAKSLPGYERALSSLCLISGPLEIAGISLVDGHTVDAFMCIPGDSTWEHFQWNLEDPKMAWAVDEWKLRARDGSF